ncbi:hypothetical protein [Sinanaerobacter sp. ZZT-01]|uniref:hypothetical protein n=1 Tax=Sinanaerobacter sp. ZZT-01 TaxID=3111540 RepID=UPI002D76D8EF|nr:hypothetical protein [Sinanaerobacter sp. ZZT-01]WRR92728.1 hypothetical protein U5921_11825 [Sinanaerobacter sp. ZZT-01]
MGITEPNLTAYDVLYKVMKKYSGWWVAFELPFAYPETMERVKSGESFKRYWDIVLRLVTNLIISTDPIPLITCGLTNKGIETEESKIQRLKSCAFPKGYYLLTVIDFEECMEVRWFETKSEAIEKKKWLYKNEEMLFFCKVVKI